VAANNACWCVFNVLPVYNELQSERDEDNQVSRELIAERGNTAAVEFINTSVKLQFHASVVPFVISVDYSLILALYKLFVSLFTYLISLLFSYTFLLVYFLTYLFTSSRIDPFHFQAGGHRRRPNLALVFWGVYFMLWYILMWMHVYFYCICFSVSVISQKVGWEECLRSELFYVGWDVKP